MAWYMIVLCVLAAFGLTCTGWALFGWCFGSDKGCILLGLGRGKAWSRLLTRYRFLHRFGLLRCPLILVGSPLSPQARDALRHTHPEIEFCTLEELPARLETEK